ncbi:26S proteasome regulatory subunit S5A [Trichophyton equinum CBS 127.97]|uniref:26S proteasome regulatory subunit S5A n=1 Tax=Trichophyton equinum (strain ATCC MYA-4606 / CBS 127.97) TaxID=559882 RepID=F2PGE5_TRIEC|nr:26S proteasome regulatory subunit S5A [Trichophyton equinum CBS 127.97]
MSLEATMIIIDNSESSRNGDYLPTRFEAQADAVNLVHSVKTQAHPQSAVGLMSMGGNGPEVLVTLTEDIGKILEGLHRTKIGGTSHLASSIQVAYLALKHRKEKAQRQRIIVFSCSPVVEDEKSFVKLALKMKKNNKPFHEAVNSGNGSNLVIIPPGPNLLSDSILPTPILGGRGMGSREAGEDVGGGSFDFGIDPSADPELAFALRMSLEEEKARLEKEKQEKEKQAKESMDKIPEEGGEASGSGSGKKDNDKKEGDGDKMDTS